MMFLKPALEIKVIIKKPFENNNNKYSKVLLKNPGEIRNNMNENKNKITIIIMTSRDVIYI